MSKPSRKCIDCGAIGRQKGRKRCRSCFAKWMKTKIPHPNSLIALKEGRKKAKPNLGKFRENSSNWKGGRVKGSRGYILIRKSEHPNAIHGYVPEHRLIMEKFLGRYLESWEMVHHRNGIRDDNQLDNLEIVIRKAHFGKVRCPKCLYEFLIK